MSETTVIPSPLVDFARELCRVAKKHQIDDMHVRFNCGIMRQDMSWPHSISVTWEQGRHGAADDRMHVSTEVTLNVKIADPFGAKLVTVPEPTSEQIADGAEQLWNDMHARLGGEWPGPDSDLVSVKQCMATARAVLMAGWRPR
jgi:hypothetical protein